MSYNLGSYREPLLHKRFREGLYSHIRIKAKYIDVILLAIGGVKDHVHCLVSLRTTDTVSKVVKDLKGSASRWINDKNLVNGRFEWQRGYGAFSVSRHDLDMIIRYIEYQETHHSSN